MSRFLSILAAAALLIAPVAARAADNVETYTLETPHTQIVFAVNHLGFSNSIGKFLGYSGTIHFDRTDPAKSNVDVVIKSDSLEINDDAWNKHLKNADFLDVEKFPEITFKSTGIAVTGEKTADITGDLTIKGVTKPVVLKTTFNNAGPHPMNPAESRAGFSATTSFKRSDFGINYGIPAVGDDVEVRIEVESILQAKPATNQ